MSCHATSTAVSISCPWPSFLLIVQRKTLKSYEKCFLYVCSSLEAHDCYLRRHIRITYASPRPMLILGVTAEKVRLCITPPVSMAINQSFVLTYNVTAKTTSFNGNVCRNNAAAVASRAAGARSTQPVVTPVHWGPPEPAASTLHRPWRVRPALLHISSRHTHTSHYPLDMDARTNRH